MRNPITKEQEEIIVQEYVENKRGQAFVCKQAGVSVGQLKDFLKANGYHIRTQGEAATVSNKNRTKKKNEDYFSVETPNMAWLVGFLAADGCIAKNKNEIALKLSSVDEEILERIKEEVQIENNIGGYMTSTGFPVSSLAWTCAQHKKDLARYNVVPDKTFILKPPYEMDRKYWVDYIRGYFDGDGSVNYIQSNSSIRWQVASATKEMLEFILDYFYEEYNIPKVNIQTAERTNAPIYVIQYSTNSSKKIYDILYNTGSTMYLKRKKDKFEDIIDFLNSLK